MGRVARTLAGATEPDTTARAKQEQRSARIANFRARGDEAFSRLGISIDLATIERLQRSLYDVGLDHSHAETALVRALNEGSDRLYTRLKRDLQRWTGLRRQVQINNGMRHVRANRTNLVAGVRIVSPWTKITVDDFGATWKGRGFPVKHYAWGRAQFAPATGQSQPGRGIFLMRTTGTVFKRVGTGKWAIRPLYGPNLVREIERHAPYVRAQQRLIARDVIVPEAVRQIRVRLEQHSRERMSQK